MYYVETIKSQENSWHLHGQNQVSVQTDLGTKDAVLFF